MKTYFAASKMKLILMTLLILFVMAGCSDTTTEEVATEAPEETSEETAEETIDEELPSFTMEEIAEYDGLDGSPAYIVVDGLVYDVTESSMWQEGNHQGQFQAGQDLTEEIHEKSPHGTGVLDRMEIVGQVEE
ncbi:Predicted heme/steroid binding protein [Tindallia magadiensis]|uniref:Predicted heme/steroid binding protein n=1 Tax=Tindallia magadiensis TaxID=69895 RepID=A0A1I3B1N1_9FIRM|nr:cytochrome b5 domain-containing protein [Tindallia magadiensis]SFH56102.1 Predicted heme/steroid binding protein [Tindallia magadiensis]